MKNKIYIFLLILLTTSINASAQVACNAKLLTNTTNFCSKDAEYTNVGTPNSKIGLPTCWTDKSASQEIWYKFNAIGTDVNISVSGGGTQGTIVKPNIAIYNGDCTAAGTFNQLGCADGTKNITQLYNPGLTPGGVYYIRIATTAANAGTFTLCIDNSTPTANPGADCDGAVKLCSKDPVHAPGLKGGGKNVNEPEKGSCLYQAPGGPLTSEGNSCWYYWICGETGTLTFDLTPVDLKHDLDFNLYSLTSGTDVCKNRKLERCSAASVSYTTSGVTGLSTGATDTQQPPSPPFVADCHVKEITMIAGTTYAILINNFNSNAGFTITFGGTGTFQGPTADITTDRIIICPGKEITYDGSKSINFTNLEWNFTSGSGTPTAANGVGPHIIKYNTPGNYVGILKATDNLGCNSVKSINIDVVDPTPITVTSDTICSGELATLTASPAVSGATYNWSPTPDSGNGTATVTVTPTSQQTYTVTCENGGCVTTNTGTVYMKSDITIASIPPINICIGSSVTLTAAVSGGSGDYTYNWLPAGTGNTASVSVSPISSVDYTVTVTDNINGGCPPSPIIIKVTVNPPLQVSAIGSDTICLGSSTVISATASGGDGGPYTYTWQPSGAIGPVISVNPSNTTTYTVTINDNCGTPLVSDTVKVTVTPAPVVNFSAPNASGCAGPLCVDFVDSSTTTDGIINKWQWNFGVDPAGTPEGVSDLKNPTHCFVNSGQYTITLTVTNSFGCKSTNSKANTIYIEPAPIADFSAPVSISILNPTVSFLNLSTGGNGYVWNFGEPESGKKDSSILLSPNHTYMAVGEYCISLIVTSINKCIDTTTKCLVVDPVMTLYIPNVFSPNADGVNDSFFAKGEYIKEFQMRIFDRWGNMVFYSDDIDHHWDGKVKSNGEIAQQDVYVYDVRAKDINNKSRKYIGTVTLIK